MSASSIIDDQAESDRLLALRAYRILDTVSEQAYDDIALLASRICQLPSAGIALIDEHRVWFKAGVGLPGVQSVPRDHSFCQHAIRAPDKTLMVADAMQDACFAALPLVTGTPFVRCYAGAPIVTANGTPLGVVCVFGPAPHKLSSQQLACLQALARQVTYLLELRWQGEQQVQRVRDEARQARTDHEFQQAFASVAVDPKSIIDHNYVYRQVNDVYLRYWQKSRDEIVGHTVAELIGQGIFEQRVKPLLDRALQGETVTYDSAFDFPGMGERYTRVTYLPACGADRSIIGVIVRIEDIDDLKQVELTLRRSVQMVEDKNIALQRFIQVLSHDLLEPVNTIVNFTTLLQESVADMPEAARYVDFLHGSGLRLRTSLDDLKAYMDLDQYLVGDKLVALNDVFDEVKRDLRDAVNRTQAELTADKLPILPGERTLLRLLLQNLIANALKFVAPGVKPVVHVSALPYEAAWDIQVSDNGIGIDTEHCEAVFDLFKRLHSQRQYPGTGLGLATCRRIVELHDGHIWVTAGRNGGSCFHVLLPMTLRR